MNGWSKALRQELQPDIRVTVIEPGAVTIFPSQLRVLTSSSKRRG